MIYEIRIRMVTFFVVVVVGALFTTQHRDCGVVMTYLLLPSAHALTFLPPISSRTRPSSLQSSVLTTTTRRSFSTFTNGQSLFHPVKRRQIPFVLFLSSSSLKDSMERENNSNNVTMVKASYQRVAEQDPEWFQEYVLSILGQDSSLDEEFLTTTTTTRVVASAASLDSTENQQRQQQPEETYIAMPSIDENVVASVSLSSSSSSSVAPSLLSVTSSTTENVEDEQAVAEKRKQQQQLQSNSGQPAVSENGEKNQTLSLSSSASIKPATDERSQRLIPQNEEEAVIERVRRIFDDVVKELHPASSRDDYDNADDESIAASIVQEELVVEPVKDDKKDVKPKDEVLGVPVKNEGEKNEEATSASTTDDFSMNDNPDQKLFEPLSSQSLDATTSLINTSAAVSSPTKEKSEAPQAAERKTTAATQQPLSSSKRIIKEDAIDVKEDWVVLYKGISARPWRRVQLSNLTALGYNEREIVSLQPDALDLIVSEGITKPRSGIPSRWKTIKTTITADAIGAAVPATSNSNNFVQIMSPSDADRFVKQQRAERVLQNEKGQQKAEDGDTTNRGSATVGPEGPGRDGELRRSTREQGRAWNGVEEQNRAIRQDSDRRRQQQRRRERTQYTDDGRPKRVYSGRLDGGPLPPPGTRSMARRGDPPAPDSFLWPDVDTFRDLLRKEAGFRLAILGDDWSGVVKDESDWRLNLYTDWLWTLHNGWGSPIVESRSDRMRKSLNRTTRPPREPQPQQQQRPSPYDDNGTDDDDDKRRPRPRARAKRPRQKQEEE